jgi:hypothetical protein
VEIDMVTEEEPKRTLEEKLQRLLREIDKRPAARALSEDQVAEEIAEHRAGRRRTSSTRPAPSSK